MQYANRRSILLLCLIAFFQGMVFYGPIATLYRGAAGVGIAQIAIIESISYLLTLLLEMPWGLVTARIGYKNTLLCCCALYFISKIIFWRAEGFATFLVERVLLSAVLAGFSGCDSAYLFRLAGARSAQRVFGFYEAAQTSGLIVAGVVFSIFIGNQYRLAALLTVFSYGAAALLALFLAPVPSEAADIAPVRVQLRSIVQNLRARPSFILLLAAGALLCQTAQSVTVFLNQFLYARAGMSASLMGACYIGVTLAGLAGAWSHRVWGVLGTRRCGVLLFGLSALCCAVLATARGGLACFVCICFLRVASSLYAPFAMARQNDNATSGARAVLLSGYAMAGNVAASAISVGLGHAAQNALPSALVLGAALCGAGLVCFLAWERKKTVQS